jgi:hypothetical protein
VALKKPTAINATPPVSPKAVALASDLAHIDLTRFRFKTGCGLIGFAVFIFFLGHLLWLAQFFSKDFTDRSWTLTKILLALGVAFAGKEVAEAFGGAIKSLWK